MQKQADIWKPALMSGALFGFLSGVPLVEVLNVCCCSLFIGAGILSAYLVIKGSLEPVTYGRAALAGFLSAVLGTPFFALTSILFTLVFGVEEEIREAIDQVSAFSPEFGESAEMIGGMGVFVLVGLVLAVMVVFFLIFGTLGGVIGRALFEKRSPLPPAAPMPGGSGPIDPGASPPPAYS